MNWKLVLKLATLGVGMGILSVFGLTRHGVEPILWLAISLLSAFVIAKSPAPKPFLHGLFAGILMGIANGLVMAAFFGTYLENNPEAAEAMKTLPAGFDPRVLGLLFAPVIGLGYGIVLGAFAWLGARVLRKREPARL